MPDFTDFAPSDDDHCEDTAAYMDEDPRPLMFDGEVQCWHCQEIDLASEMKYDPKKDRYCCHHCLNHLERGRE